MKKESRRSRKMETIYSYPKGSPLVGADAARIASELEAIQEKIGPNLSPLDVVNAARDRKSYLHGLFEWDDRKAAEKHRLSQAREVLRITVVSESNFGTREPVRYFVSMRPTDKGLLTYIPTINVMSDQQMRERLLQEALDDAQSWRRKYEHLKELASIFEAIERTAQKKAKRRAA